MLFVLKTTYLVMHACANIPQEAWQVLDRLADIRQAVLPGLARLADIHRAVLRGLTILADIRRAVMRESCKFGASGHSLIISSIFDTFWFPFIFLLLYSFNHFNHFRQPLFSFHLM
jgi:hypothetical protein